MERKKLHKTESYFLFPVNAEDMIKKKCGGRLPDYSGPYLYLIPRSRIT